MNVLDPNEFRARLISRMRDSLIDRLVDAALDDDGEEGKELARRLINTSTLVNRDLSHVINEYLKYKNEEHDADLHVLHAQEGDAVSGSDERLVDMIISIMYDLAPTE